MCCSIAIREFATNFIRLPVDEEEFIEASAVNGAEIVQMAKDTIKSKVKKRRNELRKVNRSFSNKRKKN